MKLAQYVHEPQPIADLAPVSATGLNHLSNAMGIPASASIVNWLAAKDFVLLPADSPLLNNTPESSFPGFPPGGTPQYGGSTPYPTQTRYYRTGLIEMWVCEDNTFTTFTMRYGRLWSSEGDTLRPFPSTDDSVFQGNWLDLINAIRALLANGLF